MTDYSYNVWKKVIIFTLVFVGILIVGFLAEAKAAVCNSENSAETVQELQQIIAKHDLDAEIYTYEGEKARNIREFIKTKAGEVIPLFDKVVIAKTRTEPNGYISVYLNDCQIFEIAIPASDYFEVKTIGDGV